MLLNLYLDVGFWNLQVVTEHKEGEENDGETKTETTQEVEVEEFYVKYKNL